MDDLLADFLTETHEGLVALNSALVRLERAPDDQPTLSEVFRLVHTIKGTCGFLGLPRLERVAHAAENVLGQYRDGTLPVTPGGITLILSALDRVKAIVAGIESGGAEPAGDDAALIAALNAAAEGKVPAVSGPDPLPVAEPVPAVETIAPSTVAEAPPFADAAAAPQTIRVAVDVLEDLMTLVSELVLTRNQLLQLARVHQSDAFAVPLQRLSHITSDLQQGVMKTRMQPIGNAWAKLPRLVRDLALELGKKIELDMRGAQTELDRQVLELIRDPLTHMVRNSGDHGLEPAADRRAAGKPETGRIILNAYHEGGHIIIEVGDDGRGLPVERIRAKALANGLTTESDLAQMSEREILRFIFAPGFSTAQKVTAVSGRGVGMDVVKTNIEKIGGTVELASKEGKGTTFTIKIPLTLAIASALIVEAGGERFALPQIGVVELVRVAAGGARKGSAGGARAGAAGGARTGSAAQDGAPRIERIKDTPVLRLRDRLLPLVSLAGLLRLPPASDDAGFVSVMQVGGQAFGIILDRVFDTEEIVVKPVAPILRHITMFSGNTILGDGSVIMILDPNGISRAAGVGLDAVTEEERRAPAAIGMRSNAHTALLLFRAGDGGPKAVPLGLVARLEDIPGSRIEMSGLTPVVQYRGALMPIVPVSARWTAPEGEARQPVLVFTENDRAMGLAVEEILDVLDEALEIQPGTGRPGFIGSAVVAGRVTEVIDTAYWLAQAGDDWFRGTVAARGGAARQRLLLVEDSAFFRHLVVPALSAGGYDVTAVDGPMAALRLREDGVPFDAIVSDIEMPDMDGIAFAQALRAGGAWSEAPLIALSSRAEPADVARGREAGFTDYVAKYDREALLQSLADCLAAPLAA